MDEKDEKIKQSQSINTITPAEKKKAYIAAVFFSILVGFSFLGIKVCQPYISSMEIIAYRYDFAFVTMVILIAFGVVKVNLKHKSKGKLIKVAVFYVLFMALQVVGLLYATSVEGAIFFAIIPIFVKILALFMLGEKSTKTENFFIALTVAALLLMIIMGATDITIHPIGIICLLLSSVSTALNNVYMRAARNEVTPIEITWGITLMGVIPFNIYVIVGHIINGDGITAYFRPLATPEVFIATFFLGVGCILLTAQLMSYMQSKLEAVKAAIFGNVSTTISIVAGVIILKEPLEWYHIVCTIGIIAGVVGLSFAKKPKEDK